MHDSADTYSRSWDCSHSGLSRSCQDVRELLNAEKRKGHAASSSSKRRLIRSGILIHGTGADPIEDGAILNAISGIVEIGPSSVIRSTGVEIIETGGRTCFHAMMEAERSPLID